MHLRCPSSPPERLHQHARHTTTPPFYHAQEQTQKLAKKKTSTVLKSHLAGPPVSLSASPPRSRRGYPPLCRQIVSSCEATPRAHHLAARAVRLFVPAAVCVRKKLSRSRLFIPAASVRSTARRDFRATVLSTGRRHSISLLLSTGTL